MAFNALCAIAGKSLIETLRHPLTENGTISERHVRHMKWSLVLIAWATHVQPHFPLTPKYFQHQRLEGYALLYRPFSGICKGNKEQVYMCDSWKSLQAPHGGGEDRRNTAQARNSTAFCVALWWLASLNTVSVKSYTWMWKHRYSRTFKVLRKYR